MNSCGVSSILESSMEDTAVSGAALYTEESTELDAAKQRATHLLLSVSGAFPVSQPATSCASFFHGSNPASS